MPFLAGPHFRFGLFCSTVCLAGLTLAYHASRATSGSVVDIFAACFLFGGGLALVFSLLLSLKRWRIVRIRVAVGIAGIALFIYNLMPSVTANAMAYRSQIVALAKDAEAGRAQSWPKRLGPFTFWDAFVNEDGVLLVTRTEANFSDGDIGIQWNRRRGAGLIYNWAARPIGPDIFLISR